MKSALKWIIIITISGIFLYAFSASYRSQNIDQLDYAIAIGVDTLPENNNLQRNRICTKRRCAAFFRPFPFPVLPAIRFQAENDPTHNQAQDFPKKQDRKSKYQKSRL